MALSPSLPDSVHVTCAELLAGRARALVGGVGATAVSGVTAFDAAEIGPGPLALTASTLNV